MVRVSRPRRKEVAESTQPGPGGLPPKRKRKFTHPQYLYNSDDLIISEVPYQSLFAQLLIVTTGNRWRAPPRGRFHMNIANSFRTQAAVSRKNMLTCSPCRRFLFPSGRRCSWVESSINGALEAISYLWSVYAALRNKK